MTAPFLKAKPPLTLSRLWFQGKDYWLDDFENVINNVNICFLGGANGILVEKFVLHLVVAGPSNPDSLKNKKKSPYTLFAFDSPLKQGFRRIMKNRFQNCI